MIYHICYDTNDGTYLIKRKDNAYAWVDYLHIPEEWHYISNYTNFTEWFNDLSTMDNIQYLGSCTDIPSFVANHPEHFI